MHVKCPKGVQKYNFSYLYCICPRSFCFYISSVPQPFVKQKLRSFPTWRFFPFDIVYIFHIVWKMQLKNLITNTRNIDQTLPCTSLPTFKNFLSSNSWKYFLKEWTSYGFYGCIMLKICHLPSIVGKKREPGNLAPNRFSGQIRKVEPRLGKLAKIRKGETN